MSSALLVIDMQQGSFTEATPRHDTDGVVHRINQLAAQFRAAQQPVVWIQHDGSSAGEYVPGTDQWALLPGLKVREGDVHIGKTANDVFYQSQLKPELDARGIRTVYVTGCATDFCVEASVQSALAKDYEVRVVADGHTTGERPNLSAEQVIAHYNWVWQNMLPTKGQVAVVEASAVALEG